MYINDFPQESGWLPKHVGDVKKHVKGKTVPLQAWTGPDGSRSLRLPDFETIGTRWW